MSKNVPWHVIAVFWSAEVIGGDLDIRLPEGGGQAALEGGGPPPSHDGRLPLVGGAGVWGQAESLTITSELTLLGPC